MRISNRDESVTVIGHAAPMVDEYVRGDKLQIKIGCIGIHMPHEGCDGIQVYTWMASQESNNISYGLLVAQTPYLTSCEPIMSVDVDHDPSGQTALEVLLMPERVRALYARSKTQSAVNKGLAAFGADMYEIKQMFGGLRELLKMESMNPDSDVLLFCPPMMAMDIDLTGEPSMKVNDAAEGFLSQLAAGVIGVTRRLVEGGDDEDKMETLIRSMATMLDKAGLLHGDGDESAREEEKMPLGFNAKKFFAEHLN
jgi:hypothetical protein